jgi:hypothetical protein
MYLAGILGLCALLHAPASGRVSGGLPSLVSLQTEQTQSTPSQPDPQQEPVKPDPSKPEAPSQQPPQPDTSQSPETQPAKVPQPAQAVPNQPKPTQKPHVSKKPHSAGRKKRTSPAAGQAPKKTVVRQGSTADPTTQLAPGMSQEQATHQRKTTNQLLSSTDAALQKVSGQPLNSDQQETVAQIRKFMEQSKAADKEGDLQRAYKLAVKAHLLSDGLSKQ